MKAMIGINTYDIDNSHYENYKQGANYILLIKGYTNRLCINLQDIRFLESQGTNTDCFFNIQKLWLDLLFKPYIGR